eukprot:gene25314-10970_t
MTSSLRPEVDGLLTRQIQVDRLNAAAERNKQRRGIADLEEELAELGSLLHDKGEEAGVAKRRIAGLEHEVDGLLIIIKRDARQINIDRIKAEAAESIQHRRISDLEKDLAEQGRLLLDKGTEAEAAKRRIAGLEHEVDALLIKSEARHIQIDRLKAAAVAADMQQSRISDLEQNLAEKGRLLLDKETEAEAAMRRIAGLEHEVDGLLIKSDAKEIQIDRLKAKKAAAAAADMQKRKRYIVEQMLTEKSRPLRDKGEEAEATKQQIADLGCEVDGLLDEADAMHIEIHRLQAEAEARENQQRRAWQDLAEKNRRRSARQSLLDTQIRISALERDLSRILQDKKKEAEATKRRIEVLVLEVDTL